MIRFCGMVDLVSLQDRAPSPLNGPLAQRPRPITRDRGSWRPIPGPRTPAAGLPLLSLAHEPFSAGRDPGGSEGFLRAGRGCKAVRGQNGAPATRDSQDLVPPGLRGAHDHGGVTGDSIGVGCKPTASRTAGASPAAPTTYNTPRGGAAVAQRPERQAVALDVSGSSPDGRLHGRRCYAL